MAPQRAAGLYLLILTGIAGVASACTPGSRPAHVVLSVTPDAALWDAPVTISVAGLPANSAVVLRAESTDAKGTPWSATARFTSDSEGRVSNTQRSTGGSYTGLDRMGLFDLLKPERAGVTTFAPQENFRVNIAVQEGGKTVVSQLVTRLRPSQVGVKEEDERPGTAGVYGELFLPAQTNVRRPAVLVFGGSEGGLSTVAAGALLAAHGYPALALAYFDEPGLPPALEQIPLEYFATALRLLAEQPGVDTGRMAVWGTSRGSEAALLAGVYYPQLVHAVVATVPSSVVNGGLPDSSQSAWSLGGVAVPSAPFHDVGMPGPPDAPAAVIPVEKITGPLMLVCGGKDQVWPSCSYQDAITARLRANHTPHGAPVALAYPDAGHFVGSLLPYLPQPATQGRTADGRTVGSGGSVEANALGRADAWPRLLAFLGGLH